MADVKVLTLNTNGAVEETSISTSGVVNSDIFSKEVITITDVTTNSGFVNTENGICGGDIGTENFTISLPTIDYTKKFRIDVIIKIKDASTANARIEVLKNGNSWQGLSYLDLGSGNLSMNKTHLNSQGFSNIPSNSTFQYSIIGNGKRVIRNITPISTKWNGEYATTYLPTFVGQIISQSEIYNYNPSGTVEMFKDIDLISVTGSNTSQIIIESINVQYFDDPSIYEHKNYLTTLMDISILNDAIDDVYPSYLYCPANAKALIQWHHPNGYNGTISNYDYGLFFPNLFNDGYAICFGTFNSFNNPSGTSLWGAGVTSSNWGAPSGLVYRKALNDYVDSLIKSPYFIQIGGSMGAFNALSYASNYPNKIKSVIGISGALDLTYNYNNGYSSLINKAYGASYRCILASTGNNTSNNTYWTKISNEKNSPKLDEYNNPFYDIYNSGKSYIPGDVVFENYTGVAAGLSDFDLILNPKNLSKFPILLIHGNSDITIDVIQSIDFKTAINNVGGNVELDIKEGVGHLDISLFNYDYIKYFLKEKNTLSDLYLNDIAVLDFGDENNSVVLTVLNTLITNSNIKNYLIIPQETTETSLDDFSLNGVYFNIENIIDNISFDIRGTSINNASGNFTIKYSITY